MKKIYFILSLLLAMLPATVLGQAFTVDNIQYTPIGGTTNVNVTGHTLSTPTDVKIPATITNGGTVYDVVAIEKGVFWKCGYLRSITLSEGLTNIGERAISETPITSITIPKSLKTVGYSAIYNNRNLTSIILQEGLVTIGKEAFAVNSITSLEIPESVTEIKEKAFSYNNLSTVTCLSSTPPAIGTEVFALGTNGVIIVPQGCKEAYKRAWTEYASKIKSTTYAVIINVNDAAMGTAVVTNPATPDKDPIGYNDGRQITIKATPNEGYEFVTWDDGDTNAELTLTVDSDITRTATFKKKDNPNPPVVIWYKVSAPAVSGITYIRNEQEYEHLEADVLEGTTFSFFLKAAIGITPTVSTSRGDIITPRESDGKYVVGYIQQDLTIKVSTSPVGNEEIGNATKVWSETGAIVINTDSPAQLSIVGMNGAVNTLRNIPAGQTRCAVAAEAYIVTVDGKTYKVIVK